MLFPSNFDIIFIHSGINRITRTLSKGDNVLIFKTLEGGSMYINNVKKGDISEIGKDFIDIKNEVEHFRFYFPPLPLDYHV